MKTINFNEYKIRSLENDTKTNKTIATLAGATASLAAIVALGNVATGNELIALQNCGTTAAMLGYVVGYIKKIKLNNIEKNRLESKQDEPTTAKDKLIELKHTIEQTKNSLSMSTTAGIGFGVTTLANMALLSEGHYTAVGAMLLSGTVSVLDIMLALQQSKKIKSDTKRAELLEELDEISKESIPELIESPEDEKRLLK